jgi:hypothetical protein
METARTLARGMLACNCDWDIVVAHLVELFRLSAAAAESIVFDAVASEAYREGEES